MARGLSITENIWLALEWLFLGHTDDPYEQPVPGFVVILVVSVMVVGVIVLSPVIFPLWFVHHKCKQIRSKRSG